MRTPRPPPGAAGGVPPVLATEKPVMLEENVMEGLPVSVVTVANRHREIVSREQRPIAHSAEEAPRQAFFDRLSSRLTTGEK